MFFLFCDIMSRSVLTQPWMLQYIVYIVTVKQPQLGYTLEPLDDHPVNGKTVIFKCTPFEKSF